MLILVGFFLILQISSLAAAKLIFVAMSTTSSSTSSAFLKCLLHLLLLLFFTLAVCSCYARPIAVIKKQPDLLQPSKITTKDEEKLSHARVSASSNEPGVAKLLAGFLGESSENKEPKNGKKFERHQLQKEGGVDHSYMIQSKSRATVSWKVPHPNAGEKQPGFNLDYDPPQTHPPIHN